MESNRLLPDTFFISGLHNSKNNLKLFRPKQISDLILPRISMIMYHPFWIKYTLFLLSNGYYLDKQDDLFFWAIKESKKHTNKGILYFCLLSIYLRRLDSKSPDVSVGKRWSKDWLFHKEAYYNIIDVIQELNITANIKFNYTLYVDKVFSPLFQSACKKEKIDLKKIFIDINNNLQVNKQQISKKQVIESIDLFVEKLAIIIEKIKHRLPQYKNDRLIDTIIEFTKQVILSNIDEPFFRNSNKLANTKIPFSKKELIILLNQLQETENGQYFIRSFLLISTLDPLNHDNPYIVEKIREICIDYKDQEDISKKFIQSFPDISFKKDIVENLSESCFYWKLNFFLLDGEDIARNLAIKNNRLLTKDSICKLFTNNIESFHFTKFIDDTYKDKSLLDFLNYAFSIKYRSDELTASFLEVFYKCLIQKKSSCEIFIELLLHQKTIRRISDDTYEFVEKVPGMRRALFWGLEAFINWSKIIMRGLIDER